MNQRNKTTVLFILCAFISITFTQKNGNMRNFKKWKMVEYLDLSETQADKFFPKVRQFEKERKDITGEKVTIKKKLEILSESKDTDVNEVLELIDRLALIESNQVELKSRHTKQLQDILSPAQLAKYVIFDDKFRKQLKDKYQEKKKQNKRRQDRP